MDIFQEIKLLHKSYRLKNFNPSDLISTDYSKKKNLISLSFYITTMSLEILLNQPFKKKIKLLHNDFLQPFMKKTTQKVERIENNTFGYCLIIIIRKLYIKEINISQYLDEIFDYSIIHWSIIQGFNEKIYKRKYNILKELWLKNKYLALSIDKESLIDLIIELYRSFEIGVGNKKIIKENIAALIYSVSKANKEFRMDALKEIKKVLNIL
mgnify:FL=1|tara:strand:- start:3979 stop:4611 length:633 start_codon:yes stop_codon:yes gene_type:complete